MPKIPYFYQKIYTSYELRMFPDPEMSNEAIHLPQKTDFCIRQQLELHIKAWYNNLNKIWNVSKWEAEVQRNTFSEKQSWVSWINESFSFLLLQLLLLPLLQPELMLLVHLCREHSALCLNCKWSLLKKKKISNPEGRRSSQVSQRHLS